MANQRLNIDIVAKDKSTQALNKVQGSLSKVKGAVFNLRNAFIGLGAGLAIRSLVNTGKEIEGLQVRLKFLFGSAKEGAKAFDEMAKFAAKVPFSLEEIQSGSGVLSVVSKDAEELANLMEITGNVAAVTGLDFRTTAEQIQRSMSAGISAADLFRDRGVKSMLGFKAGAVVTVEETAEAFQKIFGKGGKFGGATDELANTFEGTLSMIGDKFFNFKRTILEAGFFEGLKKEFGNLNVALAENANMIEKLGVGVGTVLALGVEKVAQSIKLIAEYSHLVKETFKIIISYKLAKLFLNIGRALIPVVSGMSALAALTGPVGIGLAAAAAAAGTASYFLLGKQLDSIAEKIEENHKAFKESKRVFTGGGFDAAQYTKKDLFDIAEVEKLIAKAKEKELKLQSFLSEEINKKRLKFHELETEGVKKFKEQNDIQGQVLEKIKEQNEQFSLSSEIVNTITSFTSKISRSIAEAVILGKSLNMSFKELAQGLMVDILSKMIERIMLLTIEKFLIEKIFKQDTKKLDMEKNITKEKRKQVMYQALLMAMGGGGGGGGSFFGFAQGGAVSKDQPILVGENGPEIFRPNSTGQIEQNARGTGGGSTTVNFNINTVDASGFEELLVRSRGTITQLINSAVNERGSKNLI